MPIKKGNPCSGKDGFIFRVVVKQKKDEEVDGRLKERWVV
jgi:hypothetical protein